MEPALGHRTALATQAPRAPRPGRPRNPRGQLAGEGTGGEAGKAVFSGGSNRTSRHDRPPHPNHVCSSGGRCAIVAVRSLGGPRFSAPTPLPEAGAQGQGPRGTRWHISEDGRIDAAGDGEGGGQVPGTGTAMRLEPPA